ncbi:hypothetical protein SAMN05660649_04661 [Desulfotomaculum arcticum]|uniref:Uncharacterized protein n=1 Tax=Desulfotruncus arcticus DSM 17038 TaxID=1121424 RepID=A0A1I2YXA0_9FIRM|nr:hypothetical protein [Desulfotruncus arcticus]SFH30045.1 hypothetical protein SAMN05660649_04661 [Desulfotomaculum arcticum] [Desulfotruncus arcticus DSM 17038]
MQNKTEAIKAALSKAAQEGKLSCTAARKLAADLGVSPKEIGKVADELEIKIFACELGCF